MTSTNTTTEEKQKEEVSNSKKSEKLISSLRHFPKLIAFDLDFTLWWPEIYELGENLLDYWLRQDESLQKNSIS